MRRPPVIVFVDFRRSVFLRGLAVDGFWAGGDDPDRNQAPMPSGGPPLRDGPPGLDMRVVGSPRWRGYPIASAPRRSRPGAGVQVVQPQGAPPGRLPLVRSEASSPTRRDTRFTPRLSCVAATHSVVLATISCGQPRSLAGFRDPRLRHVREPRWDRGLIFGLIRLRSLTFIGVRINAASRSRPLTVFGELLSRRPNIGR